jgi:pyruvate dehydrogenase E1 component alpha subunit
MIDMLEIYRKMYFLRTSEEVIAQYYLDNQIYSFVHFYVGQEAVAVGVTTHLSLKDRVFGNHRSHGHYLAKGGDLGAMFAEMLGKTTGCCKGKGGSMHMLDRSVGFMGSTPILASVAPIAVGSALQQKMTKEENLTVVFVGDGAAEEGVFYESVNLAAVMELPILFVIENNLYSVNTPKSIRKSELHDYAKISTGFGVPYFKANGNDIFEVLDRAKEAVQLIKSTKSPVILECQVYRHMAHSAPIFDDTSGYRVEDTFEIRKKFDSLLLLRNLLEFQSGILNIEKIEAEINKQVDLALDFAINSPSPEPAELFTGVFL